MGLYQTLAQSQAPIKKAKVLVVGDVMLDRYWFGDVNRISPEAPVPVALIKRQEDRPGGAANVARNIASLGGQATLLSVVGDDEAGQALVRILNQEGVRSILKKDAHIDTTLKLRVLTKQQQLIRVDFEAEPSTQVLDDKLRDYQTLVAEHDVVILSDYAKGVLKHIEPMITYAKAQDKIVLVDPKSDDFALYAGASYITPNLKELRAVLGRWQSEADLQQQVQALLRQHHLTGILLTRSEDGMSLFEQTHSHHVPTRAQEVYDVSGAGDTVIATFGLMLAAGLSPLESVQIANYAAGVVVAKLGTATVSMGELLSATSK